MFRSDSEFVAEGCSRSHVSVWQRKICRRKRFSEPLSSQSKQNLSPRAVLVTTFQSIEAKFVAESCSRDHISVHRSRICRRERFSKPYFGPAEQNLSPRAVLGTTFEFDEAKFVAESQSRNHFPFDRDKICRREPFSGPLSSSTKQNLSPRAVLVTTFEFDEAKFVAESRSRNHFPVKRSKICRRELFSEPLSSSTKQNLSQRASLGTTFQFALAEFVAEDSVHRSKICRRELFSIPFFPDFDSYKKIKGWKR
jgi:hypothetical protein